jgi:hypothetical protein
VTPLLSMPAMGCAIFKIINCYIYNIICQLRKYYQTVQTRCQLNFEVPAGFRKHGDFQRDL